MRPKYTSSMPNNWPALTHGNALPYTEASIALWARQSGRQRRGWYTVAVGRRAHSARRPRPGNCRPQINSEWSIADRPRRPRHQSDSADERRTCRQRSVSGPPARTSRKRLPPSRPRCLFSFIHFAISKIDNISAIQAGTARQPKLL